MGRNVDRKIFNKSLDDYIHVKYISINETAGHASLRYLSTLAVLQLDAILPNAILKALNLLIRRPRIRKGSVLYYGYRSFIKQQSSLE